MAKLYASFRYSATKPSSTLLQAWQEFSKTCVNTVRKKLSSQFVCSFKHCEKKMSYDGMPNKTVILAKKIGLLDDAANGDDLLNVLGAKVTTTQLMEFEAAGRATS